nr:hypothetical protein [Rhodoferax sp.]
MNTQFLVVGLLVSGCSLYALWTLMPAAARRVIAQGLLRLPLGLRLKAPLQRAASTSSGCDCSGCDKVVDKQRNGETQPIRFHARTKR